MSMYDASLDAFIPHQWSMGLYPSMYSRHMLQDAEAKEVSYWALTYHWDQNYQDVPFRQYRDLNTYGYYPEGNYYPGGRARAGNYNSEGAVMMQAAESAPAPKDMDATSLKREKNADGNEPPAKKGKKEETTSVPPLRTALDETVFFYPQIATDAKGNLTFNFKMKEG